MRVVQAKQSTHPPNSAISVLLDEVSLNKLKQCVTTLAVPRHFRANASANQQTAEFIQQYFSDLGYRVIRQGSYDNILALPKDYQGEPLWLVSAHFDSVPDSPGADDNASAVAALLEAARVLANAERRLPVAFVAFNCEEDGLVGSTDFVANYLPTSGLTIAGLHNLEMVGYCNHAPDSQCAPQGLPIKIPATGDFLGIVGNQKSNFLVDRITQQAADYVAALPVIGLKIYLGAERLVPDLSRSDHDPFWRAGIPAVMWTDTSEFRNPNYHRVTDTPETLDYEFLANVTRLLVASLVPVV
jgi:Zn-dependent M28 family amino/carboxypeptidase